MPSALVDGSPAHPAPVELEGIDGPTVATRVRVRRSTSLNPGSRTARCVGAREGIIVERIGVSGATVTVLGSEQRDSYGCDATTVRAGGSPWCGHAYAQLRSGRLRDPRLSLSCRGADGELVGFAWIRPVTSASFVVVARRRYSEVYPVVSRLPVRVVTDDVDQGSASATFEVSEHTEHGRRLRAYVLEARVSG